MSCLLVQGCSKRKKESSEPVSALDLYDGYYYRIIKKAIRNGELRDDIDICVLSAKYGIVDEEEEVEYYNRKMTEERADDLREEAITQLVRRVEDGEYDRVIVNLGRTYERVVKGFEDQIRTPVTFISGGLGERGHVLKRFIRTDKTIEITH